MLVARKIRNQDVIDLLFQLFILRGIPEHIPSDNGPEFTTRAGNIIRYVHIVPGIAVLQLLRLFWLK
jgi:hypothetical protein